MSPGHFSWLSITAWIVAAVSFIIVTTEILQVEEEENGC
jgi:hypothetical protein